MENKNKLQDALKWWEKYYDYKPADRTWIPIMNLQFQKADWEKLSREDKEILNKEEIEKNNSRIDAEIVILCNRREKLILEKYEDYLNNPVVREYKETISNKEEKKIVNFVAASEDNLFFGVCDLPENKEKNRGK